MKFSFGNILVAGSSLMLLCSAALIPAAASAKGLIPDPTGKCPEDYKPLADGTYKTTPLSKPCQEGDRDYALDDLKVLLSNIGNFMLGISGTILLFVFTLGGFYWLTSQGNAKTYQKGTDMMKSGVIGLLILFGAYTLVVFGLRVVGGDDVVKYAPKLTDPNSGDTAVIYSITKPAPGSSATQACGQVSGTCAPKGTCNTAYALSGACSGGQDCCVKNKNPDQTTACGQLGGTCQTNTKSCSGPYVKNLCAGAATNVQCCLGL